MFRQVIISANIRLGWVSAHIKLYVRNRIRSMKNRDCLIKDVHIIEIKVNNKKSTIRIS